VLNYIGVFFKLTADCTAKQLFWGGGIIVFFMKHLKIHEERAFRLYSFKSFILKTDLH